MSLIEEYKGHIVRIELNQQVNPHNFDYIGRLIAEDDTFVRIGPYDHSGTEISAMERSLDKIMTSELLKRGSAILLHKDAIANLRSVVNTKNMRILTRKDAEKFKEEKDKEVDSAISAYLMMEKEGKFDEYTNAVAFRKNGEKVAHFGQKNISRLGPLVLELYMEYGAEPFTIIARNI